MDESKPPNDELAEACTLLGTASTATIASQLLRRGFRNIFIRGATALRPDRRMIGPAFTLRYAPAREDVVGSHQFDNLKNVQRLAIERIPAGHVLVIDARGDTSAAVLGNILATRLLVRGAAGIVTDGAVRDSPAFGALDLPVYASAGNATISSVAHYPVDMDVPVGCGGVLVVPGDILVGDGEGVVVVPRAIAREVGRDAAEQEQVESYVLQLVEGGAPLHGTYPPSDAVRERALSEA